MRRAFGLLLALLLPFAAGCASSIAARIQERSAVFYALEPDAQNAIREGQIEAGFTADMVYIALGSPSRIEQSSPGEEKWIYRNYISGQAAAASFNGPTGDSGSMDEVESATLVVHLRYHRVTYFKVLR